MIRIKFSPPTYQKRSAWWYELEGNALKRVDDIPVVLIRKVRHEEYIALFPCEPAGPGDVERCLGVHVWFTAGTTRHVAYWPPAVLRTTSYAPVEAVRRVTTWLARMGYVAIHVTQKLSSYALTIRRNRGLGLPADIPL